VSLTLPYPGQPALNSTLASAPVLANLTAITQAIQAFDGSQVNAGSLVAGAFNSSINPNTLLHDIISPFVQSGCIWAATTGLVATMTGGTIYVGTSSAMYRVIVNGIGSHTFTASQDTYIDIDYNGNVYYQGVANGASAPALTANALRVAKVITGASAVTSVVQTGVDSLSNPIYPVGAVAASNIDFATFRARKSVDTNGWTVYDMGGWQTYKKRVTYTISAAQGPASLSMSSTYLPSYMSVLGTNFIEMSFVASGNGYEPIIHPEMTTTSSSLNASFYSPSGAITQSGFIDWTITSA